MSRATLHHGVRTSIDYVLGSDEPVRIARWTGREVNGVAETEYVLRLTLAEVDELAEVLARLSVSAVPVDQVAGAARRAVEDHARESFRAAIRQPELDRLQRLNEQNLDRADVHVEGADVVVELQQSELINQRSGDGERVGDVREFREIHRPNVDQGDLDG